MASTSTAGSKRKNEDTSNVGPFHELAPSASISASSLLQKPRYDVFINHRGPDVKEKLASRLYNIFNEMKLTAFLDSEELEYGDFLPTTLQAAMRSASLHIAIFSENYAKSPWCLAELSFMLKTGAKIIPVFYYVEPTDLRYVAQGKGIYVDAFVKYEEKRRYSAEKLQEWKMALNNVSFYIGQIIKNDDDEMRLLKNIVNIVLKEIKNVPLVVANHPVGLEEILLDFERNTVQSVQEGVHIVGIWGMGGSGKTTLAKKLYNERSSSMERSSFIFDVRDGAVKNMLHNKQIELLKGLGVKKEDRKFENIEQGKAILTKYLRSVRVLIVLDDVDHVDQLDALLPVKDSLGGGSLIIVTTRENEVLRSKGILSVYKMRALDPFYAEQLFCWHAFSQSIPLSGFENLVKKFLDACNGLPLSLKVFGGQLYGEFRKEYWESLLQKILRILPNDIKEKLKVSYDALHYEEKEMFLDTACFFIGEENSLAIEVWNGSRWSGLHGWEKLFNKCLVELDEYNCIKMHDHLRDLGREIANQHSPYRLWLAQQIINKTTGIRGIMPVPKEVFGCLCAPFLWFFGLLQKTTGIRGIMAVPSSTIIWKSREPVKSYQMMDPFCEISSDEELMANTIGRDWSLAPSFLGPKIFVIRGDYFNKVICEVSRELAWLRWFEIGQKSLPSRLSLKNLRVLELYEKFSGVGHHLEELWEAESDAPVQLRVLVIAECDKFQRFPNSIGRLNMLKKMVLTNGSNLTSLPEEFCCLQSLEHLQLQHCKELSSLPTRFGDLSNLRFLLLSSCWKLRMLPVSFKKLMLLQYLDLESCSQLILRPEDFQNISKLEYINLSRCKQLKELPRHITNQASLRELYLEGANKLRELPNNIGQLSRLQEMIIGTQLLTSLPISIGDLTSLRRLSIEDCPSLESLPTTLGNLSSLRNLSIINCPSLKCLPQSVEHLNLLENFRIQACPIKVDFGVASLPFGLSNLKDIMLIATEVCRISLPESLYSHLESLYLHKNDHLMEIEALPTTLKSIRLRYCKMLKNVRAPCYLVNLERLEIVSCPELEELPSFESSTSLREFEVLEGCYRVQKIEGLEHCTRLVILKVDSDWEVPGIESMENFQKLRRVELRANKGSAIEHCIQTIKKWPDEIQICMRAAPDASSLVHSVISPDLVIDSFANRKIQSMPKLANLHSSNGDTIMLCFVINCVTPQMTVMLELIRNGQYVFCETLPKFENGRWAWIGVFSPCVRGEWHTAQEFEIEEYGQGGCGEEDQVEEGFLVRGEEQTVVEAFHSFLSILQSR